MDLRFEWDQVKAESNTIKHDLAFEDAAHVFVDDSRIEEFGGNVGQEERWNTIGAIRVDGKLIIMVAHTIREEADNLGPEGY